VGSAKSIVNPDGSATSTTYSANSSVVTETIIDPAGKTRVLGYDGLGRLISVTEDPNGLNYSTAYTYNALDDLLSVTQGSQLPGCASGTAQVSRSFSYDSLSRLTSACNPESGTTNYTYPTPSAVCSGDPSAVCTRTDARAISTTYTYNDPLNRLTSKTYSDGTPTANFFYDAPPGTMPAWSGISFSNPKGRLVLTCTGSPVGSCTSPQTATVHSYDSMGRTNSYWQCTPANCATSSIWPSSYQYKYTGEVWQWLHPAGYTLTNTISPARRITAIQSSWVDNNHPQSLAQSVNYMPWGAVSQLVNGYAGSGANAQETYIYNNRLQPAVIELGTTGNSTADYCLVYDYYGTSPTGCSFPSQGTNNNGNVRGYWYQDSVNTSQFPHTAAYAYDGANRLATATAKTLSGSTLWSQAYSYDQWGNFTWSGSGICPSLTWNSQNNQLLTIGRYSFSYDAAGNMTQDPSDYPVQPVHTYQWDAEERVASVDGGSTWSFTYNALGHRVQWAYAGGADQHLFDPSGVWLGNVGEYSVVWWGDKALAVYLWGNTTLFNHANVIGSTSMRTNQSGGPSEDIVYYPWGDVWLLSGSGGYNFANMPYTDVTTNTDLTTARVFGPNFGRWFTPDPLGGHLEDPQTLNKYAYARNNPTTLTDPTGLDFYQECQQTKDNTQTCNTVKGYGNLTFYGTTDQSGQFHGTVITSASLQDPNSGNTAVVNASGVQLTTANGTSEGVFINGTPSATIQGDPNAAGWSNFTFNVFGSDVQHGNLDYGTATYKWPRDQADVVNALSSVSGEFVYPKEGQWYNNHPGYVNFRFSTGADPSLVNYGPSPHFTVPQNPGATVPVGPGYVTPFHVDSMTGPGHLLCAKLGVCL
jgi:RHS repeat-associated protein